MQRDIDTIKDILSSCKTIESFISGFSEQDFYSDEKTQSAVIYQLMIIGEGSKRLSLEFQQMNAQIPWSDWGGFRNVLIHQYDGVELEQVWNTILKEIPELISNLEKIIQTNFA